MAKSKGLEIVGNGLDKFIEDSKRAIKQAVALSVAEEAQAVVELARELCPVDSGKLRNSIHVKHEEGSMFASVRAGAANPVSGMDYGFLVHFGYTKGGTKIPGRPFLYQAEEQRAPHFSAFIKQKIADETKK